MKTLNRRRSRPRSSTSVPRVGQRRLSSNGDKLAPWEGIIDALRAELLLHGELLNLFDQQQEALLERAPGPIAEAERRLAAQQLAVTAQRSQRESLVLQLQGDLSHLPLLELVPQVPRALRPLVEALLREVIRLMYCADRRAGQNALLQMRMARFDIGNPALS